jgi:dTDP-4-amino-4,6-dideoxygalactose transaminase
MITPRTTGIIGVHLWGRPCDVDRLTEIALKHNLKLLFDAAHAFGCSRNGTMAGNFGNAEVFSFHATKIFNTFEGGAVVTNDDRLAGKIRLMKNFGFSGYDNVIYIGSNGKMSEISAAMGLSNFDKLRDFVECNRRNYLAYRRELQDIPGISILPYDEREDCNFQYIVVLVDRERSRIERDSLIEILQAENVLARRYFYPGCHRMEPYRSYFPHSHLMLPVTEKLAKQVLLLPTGNSIGEADVRLICHLLRISAENAEEINARRREGSQNRTPDRPVVPAKPLSMEVES